MELNKVKDALDRVTKKQELSFSKANEVIYLLDQEMQAALIKLQAYMDQDGPTSDLKGILTELTNKLNEIGALNYLENSHKELNIAVNKYDEVLEQSFFPDISRAYRNVNFDTRIINQIIAIHFYRSGLFDVGDSFIGEVGDSTDAASLRIAFLEMHGILEAIKSRNLEPAINWVSSHRDKLSSIGSKLELELHKLHLGEVLHNGSKMNAMEYVQKHFVPLATIHILEIQKLMGCLLQADHLEHFLHAELLSPRHWESLAEDLTRDYCHLLGQAFIDPLRVVIAAGIQGLPTLLKLSGVTGNDNQEWQTMKQLPVPVELGKEFQFHSIFICPISIDQATTENPPVRLPCGHVLCWFSIVDLPTRRSRHFKCPFCRREATYEECQSLIL